MTQPLNSPSQTVKTAELRAVLEKSLSHYFRAKRSIAGLERRSSAYRSSFAIEELDVRMEDGATLQLVFKDLSRQALLEGARQVKPSFLYEPLREIEIYSSILASQGLGTAKCYGTVVDQQIGRYWLFLEKVDGVELYQVGEFGTWLHVSRWLALMHDGFTSKINSLTWTEGTHLLNYDGDFYRMWLRRARSFLRQAELSRSAKTWRRIEWLVGRYDQVVERLVAQPATLIHGEFYASNVLVQEAEEEPRICPVDWEMAAVGPGLIDLAALTAGRWTDGEKKALAMAYRAALKPHSDRSLEPEAFLAILDCCHLHLAMQWLGWSRSWSPPREHAQDWLSEAFRLAEKLGL